MPRWDNAPQAHRRVSNFNFDIWIWGGGTLYISHEKLPKDGTVLCHLGFKSKVLPGTLTDLSAKVGKCTSSPQQGVKYQLLHLKINCVGWGLYEYHMKNISRMAKFLPTWGSKSKVLSGSLTDVSA